MSSIPSSMFFVQDIVIEFLVTSFSVSYFKDTDVLLQLCLSKNRDLPGLENLVKAAL